MPGGEHEILAGARGALGGPATAIQPGSRLVTAEARIVDAGDRIPAWQWTARVSGTAVEPKYLTSYLPGGEGGLAVLTIADPPSTRSSPLLVRLAAEGRGFHDSPK
jgi:lipid-binding SYLF domain-containing protein